MNDDWHVLVLRDSEQKLLGVWGPYADRDTAEQAMDALDTWPLTNGDLEPVKCLPFTVSDDGADALPPTGTTTNTGPYTVTWDNGTTHRYG